MAHSIDHTHEAAATSWIPGANDHTDFPIQNLPLGVFSASQGRARIGTAIGDCVLDLNGLVDQFPAGLRDALADQTLNQLLGLPASDRLALRHRIFTLLAEDQHRSLVEPHLYLAAETTMHLPARIGDYSDFYVGIHHATNVGRQFRPDNPLLPNYKHIPIGYHGRASSIRPSGHSVMRPSGQRKAPDDLAPEYGPSAKLDYELELGVWIAGKNNLGTRTEIADAGERIAGLCLLNDWSARDLQAWEYQPLGPFLAKNFMTTISAWIVTAEALAPFRLPQGPRPNGDPQPLPYLWDETDQASGALALDLEVFILTAAMRKNGLAPVCLSRGPAANMYWTIAQMVAHHTASGCNLMPGDLLGTGTISGPQRGSEGSLMEISLGGNRPFALPNGETRSFLEDGDELTLSAVASAAGRRSIGFGDCRGIVAAAC